MAGLGLEERKLAPGRHMASARSAGLALGVALSDKPSLSPAPKTPSPVSV